MKELIRDLYKLLDYMDGEADYATVENAIETIKDLSRKLENARKDSADLIRALDAKGKPLSLALVARSVEIGRDVQQG